MAATRRHRHAKRYNRPFNTLGVTRKFSKSKMIRIPNTPGTTYRLVRK